VSAELDRSIARLLAIGTLASVALLGIGVVLLFTAGIAPLAGAPPFEPSRLVDDIAALRPAGFLWLGLVVVVATPTSRVVASLVGYLRRGERAMAVVAVLILVVLLASVGLAVGFEG
jgi:uncharacterized membrane protein